MIDRRTFLATGVAAAAAASVSASAARIAQTPRANGPAPWGQCLARASCAGIGGSNTPSCIFAMNTFIDKEWGYGDEDPRKFDPSDFFRPTRSSLRQKAGNLKGLIFHGQAP